MGDIGDYYEQKRQRALQLQGELNALRARMRVTAPRTPEFVLLLKQISATTALLEQARYVGD